MSNQDVDKYVKCLGDRTAPSPELVESVAKGVHKWALQHGATHHTHSFQPLSGVSSEKHDSWIQPNKDGSISSEFDAKALTSAEPDASSFPNGGLRPTHAARGNVIWDPTSPMHIYELGDAPTLRIPSCFIGWEGSALDFKTPLLRSERALTDSTLRLLKTCGHEGHTLVHSECGIEQEYFLCDEELYERRPDLQLTGRTLLGRDPPKSQAHSDRYFGMPTTRMLDAQFEIERELWIQGIPNSTRHREVAPSQYEMAPMFERCNVATDHNMLMMDIMKQVSRRHGLECLLHEKPFANMNGSGKHNNWSFGTNKVPTLFKPSNPHFMLALAAFVRAVDTHASLIRTSVATSGNDHRLGGHEAPPGIMSIYLGSDVQAMVEAFLRGDKETVRSAAVASEDFGIPCMPAFNRQPVDRNRTSPIAYTGNKFELRAVGSNQNPSFSTTVMNTITSEAMEAMADAIAALKDDGLSAAEAEERVVRDTLQAHQRILFAGNNYSEEWRAEAKARGLPEAADTVDSLKAFVSDKTRELFAKADVLTPPELDCRNTVAYENFTLDVLVEAHCMINMVNVQVLPPSVTYVNRLRDSVSNSSDLENRHKAVNTHISQLLKSLSELETVTSAVQANEDTVAAASDIQQRLRPAMARVRHHADELEGLVDSSLWILPTYHELINCGHH